MKWRRLLDGLMTALSFYKQVKTELDPIEEDRRAERRERRDRRRKRRAEAEQAKQKDK